MKKRNKTLVVILYDSITNSVFESQVLQPLLNRIKEGPTLSIHIITFEKAINIALPEHNNITWHLFKRYPFIHYRQLKREIYNVQAILPTLDNNDYTILARGPFAGYIAQKAAPKHCPITIQARGLVAKEYHYMHHKNDKLSWWQEIRCQQLMKLEQLAYSNAPNITVQAVSPALQDYLIEHFGVLTKNITLAQYDIPQRLHEKRRRIDYIITRSKLGISFSDLVLCYSGSYKPWQCPEKVGAFFKHQLKDGHDVFLLILTPDVESFERMIETMHIPKDVVHITHVKPSELWAYLSAADAGLIFREPHVMNYVARPTKALEYQAAGMHIIHNGTVAYINDMPNTQYVEKWALE